MTQYRPGGSAANYSKHSRISKAADILFSDEADSATDWLPVQRGDSVNLMINRATLQNTFDTTNIQVPGVFDIDVTADAPKGSAELQFKQGGEKDNMASPLGVWRDNIVVYNQNVEVRGFIRVKFHCQEGNFASEHQGTGGAETTPTGMLVRLSISK